MCDVNGNDLPLNCGSVLVSCESTLPMKRQRRVTSSASHGVDHVVVKVCRHDGFEAPQVVPKNPTQLYVGPLVNGCVLSAMSFVPSRSRFTEPNDVSPMRYVDLKSIPFVESEPKFTFVSSMYPWGVRNSVPF